jgi:hypothetical protein
MVNDLFVEVRTCATRTRDRNGDGYLATAQDAPTTS